ncbi:hypothetical protein MBRA1_003771 [Malassezia brasiliensis]|uniref:Integral membrane protein n=1 Tax=Malassezia brasiliensis TaxID=1821822 RepID=A0AAF0E0Z4_9BASI|nr:hypothetical protein MBRA1_003771 [Malassezia brasiliensis]
MRWRSVYAVVAALGVGAAHATPALHARHGDEHAPAPEVHASAAPHAHDAATPMANVTAFCTVATQTNATDPNCIALDAVDAFLDALEAGPALRPAPRRLHMAHHGGHAAPMEEFNETALFVRKGPVPLSYVEWDFDAGLGRLRELRRFASYQADQVAAKWPDRVVMGASGGYWRSLDDQDYPAGRTALREDVRSRIGGDQGLQEPARHPSLAVLCAVQYLFAVFVLLPVALCLHAAPSSLAPLVAVVYLGVLTAALLTGQLYFALSPALYPPNALGGMARAHWLLSVACFAPDVLALVARVARVVRGVRTYAFRRQGWRDAWHVLLGDEERSVVDATPPRSRSTASTDRTLSSSPPGERLDKDEAPFMLYDAEDADAALLSSPLGSSFRLEEPAPAPQTRLGALLARRPGLALAGSYAYTIVSRGLVPLAFAVMYVALSVYTGACRRQYQNTCLAHGIKGAIFFWYGVLSFVRFLGAFGEYGWAWNKRPTPANTERHVAQWRRTMPSAEFVECLVIFLYGVSNTWLERLGAHPGDPYTVKQIQHISIAVMFWFVGLVGMGLESVTLRSLIARVVVQAHPSVAPEPGVRADADEALAQATPPPSYAYSFNPFPALVIGVTGVAMAAHHQDYVYEVQVHILWGEMLAAFALFRMLTYFLLWLRPPSSLLPSRPPTEIMASFALTCGGLLFMLSNEEVSFAAMRSDYSDFMAMLNVAIALVALVFAWSFAVMVIKAWAQARESRKAPYEHRSHAPHHTRAWVSSM